MTAACPFCAQPNVPQALVCSSCSRDIAIPESLIAERDDLIRKRAMAGEELEQAKAELEALRRRQRISLRRS
ncbi:MAG: hypothetical protein Q7V17_09575 [Afipia sp.]|nr:hypothetical protein [Afipia sp.]